MDRQATVRSVHEWLDALSAHERMIVDHLRELVSATAPCAEESVHNDQLVYQATASAQERIVSIATAANQVRLSFRFGSSLRDPYSLLRGQQRHDRHLMVTSRDEPTLPAIRQLLEDAWAEGLARVLAVYSD